MSGYLNHRLLSMSSYSLLIWKERTRIKDKSSRLILGSRVPMQEPRDIDPIYRNWSTVK
jgi:hypothetical protein